MFSIKELRKIRSVIDAYAPMDDQYAMEIRERVVDLIQIKRAWNLNMHIKCTIADSGKDIDFK